jgi:hypothetical protein
VPDDPGSLAAIAGAGALVTIGIAGLAHSPTMQHLYGSRSWTEPGAFAGPLRTGSDHADDPTVTKSGEVGSAHGRPPTSGHPREEMR